MKKLKNTAGMITGLVLFFAVILSVIFFPGFKEKQNEKLANNKKELADKEDAAYEKAPEDMVPEKILKDGEEETEEWGDVVDRVEKYKETRLPMNVSEYYESGIFSTQIDQEKRLFSFAKNDSSRTTLIFWKKKKQKETAFPPKKEAYKKLYQLYRNVDWPRIVPYHDGKREGYLLYQYYKKEKYQWDFFCYFVEKNGELVWEKSLKKFLKAELGYDTIVQTGRNRIAVISRKERYSYCVFTIDVKRDRLIAAEEYDCFVVGVDRKYCYGIRAEKGEPRNGTFTCGQFIITDRATGKQVSIVEIPNDDAYDIDYVSHCFDISSQKAWLANRTGFYCLKPGDSAWTRLMGRESGDYLDKEYTMVDLTVVNKNIFYLLGFYDEDAESADILVKYERK